PPSPSFPGRGAGKRTTDRRTKRAAERYFRNRLFGRPDWRIIELSVSGLISAPKLCAATVTRRPSLSIYWQWPALLPLKPNPARQNNLNEFPKRALQAGQAINSSVSGLPARRVS